MEKTLCRLCNKEIYSILDIKYRKSVEIPTHFHNTCYEIIHRNAMLFEKEIQQSTEGLF